MPTAGPWATKLYVNDSPGFTGGWVMSGTPSMLLGTSIPWKWITVDSGSSLCNTALTLSPSFTLIVGPGTVPLYVQASTFLPGSTSHWTILVVRSNCLVPSANTLGASACAPVPSVLAGNALVRAAISWSMRSGVIVVGGAVAAAAPLVPPAATTLSWATMPASR